MDILAGSIGFWYYFHHGCSNATYEGQAESRPLPPRPYARASWRVRPLRQALATPCGVPELRVV